MRPAPSSARRSSGFTIVESAVAVTIFSVVGYALLLAVKMGSNSQNEVIRVASEGRSLREASSTLLEELRQTTNSQITVAVLGDQNSSLTFRQGIEIAGAFTWGVFDPSLGDDTEEQTKQDWSVRYTVATSMSGGSVNRQLLRQLLDDDGAVQKQEVLINGLCSGTAETPGFLVEDGGAVWVVTLSVEGMAGESTSKSMVMHVNTIN